MLRQRIPTLTLLFLAALLASDVAASAAPPPPYWTSVRKLCPSKHLDYIPTAILSDLINPDFEGSLPAVLRDKLDRARDKEPACDEFESAASCFNGRSFRALNKTGLFSRFIKFACTSGLSCSAPAACTKQ